MLKKSKKSIGQFYGVNAITLKNFQNPVIRLSSNDRSDIAFAVDADGVHIGQSDLPANVVRKIIGEDKILGVSVVSAIISQSDITGAAKELKELFYGLGGGDCG